MTLVPKWIDRGKFVTGAVPLEMPDDPDVTFRLFGLVRHRKVLVAGRWCSLLEWDNDNCHPDCLDFVAQLISSGELEVPIIFKVFRLGWMTEWYTCAKEARSRISELQVIRSVEPLDNIHHLTHECDPGYATSQLEQVKKGLLNDKLVVSKLEGDGSAPLVSVGENSILAQIQGREWAKSAPRQMDQRFCNVDPSIIATYEQTLATGRPKFEETWVLLPSQKNAEAWWLRVHRLVVPKRNKMIASYCFQSGVSSGLKTTFFGRPGPELSIAVQV